MKSLEFTVKLPSFKDLLIQGNILLFLFVFFILKYEYARDFTSGRLEYKWNFATITSYDVKLATIMIIVGMTTWHWTAKLKSKYKNRKNVKHIN